MSPLSARAAALFTAIVVLGCIDNLAPEDIDGYWVATTMVFTSVADSSQTYDFLADGGSFTLDLDPSGLATLTFMQGEASSTVLGTWSVAGKTFAIAVGSETSGAVAALDGNTLTLDFKTGMSHDFDGDGTEEAATMLAVLTRP